MTMLTLDFSKQKQRRRQQSNLILVTILILIAFGLVLEHQRIKTSIIEIEDSMVVSQQRRPVIQAQATAQDIKDLKSAKLLQAKLNFPWQGLLSSLEMVKKISPKISLMTIQPNPNKGEVLIAAEAANLQIMLDFVDALAKQTVFNDVLLVNQRRLGLGSKQGLSFTVKIRWQA
ncbi:MAG: hypothetical protein ACKE9I_02815 [Methylophagaceae bacterium]